MVSIDGNINNGGNQVGEDRQMGEGVMGSWDFVGFQSGRVGLHTITSSQDYSGQNITSGIKSQNITLSTTIHTFQVVLLTI